MDRIFEISGLDELREYLAGSPDIEILRRQLYAEFLKYTRYRDAVEWNIVVRLCEALAIVGWGTHEPLEAIKGKWFNGNPETYLINRYSTPRFLDAVWSKRSDGIAIDHTLSFFHGDAETPLAKPHRLGAGHGLPQPVALCHQRNWIPKNPVRVIRGIANCYPNSKPVAESIDTDLMPQLNRCMRPEMYGSSVDIIILTISFSYHDNSHCKTNYIIADETLGLRQKDFYPKLLEMYSEKEIDDNGYYLRNRFTYGPFRKDTGIARVRIVLEREFSCLSPSGQKRLLGEYMIHALRQVAKRLESKINYDFKTMISDFKSILDSWIKKDLPAPTENHG